MYNAYGSNVYKKYQVNMGNPYPVKPKKLPSSRLNAEPEFIVKQPEEDILENARQQAEQITQKAARQADEMLQQAQEKIAAYMQEVEQQAKEEGYRNGENLARQHYQSLILEAEDLRNKSQEEYRDTVLSLEEEMVHTVLEIGRKVIGMELSVNRDVIVGLIRKSLQGGSSSGEIVVTVSPEDYDYVLENRERLMEGFKNIRDISIKKDNSVQKGGCIVETGFGSVDSSIETQLKAVEDTFKELLGSASDEAAAGSEADNL